MASKLDVDESLDEIDRRFSVLTGLNVQINDDVADGEEKSLSNPSE